MKPNQVHILSTAVLRGLQQILHIEKAGFPREFVGDVLEPNGQDGIDDNVPVVHGITSADLDVAVRPHANAASDSAASNSFAKTFREYHRLGAVLGPDRVQSGHVGSVIAAQQAACSIPTHASFGLLRRAR